MRAKTKSEYVLKAHRRSLEMALKDFRRGKGVSHLSQSEIETTIAGLETRLQEVRRGLQALSAMYAGDIANGR